MHRFTLSRTIKSVLHLLCLALLLPLTASTTCPTPLGCTYQSLGCTTNAHVLNCAGRHITGHLHIVNVPPTVLTIYLNLNQITSLEPTQFHSTPRLLQLYLSNNQLTALSLKQFKYNRDLELLHLGNNKLTNLDQDIFAHVVELTNLDLSYNLLGAHAKDTNVVRPGLHPTQFATNSKLQVLDLYHNQLSSISPNQFSTLPDLTTLHLSDNQLRQLAPDQFLHNPLLLDLDVAQNPLDFVVAGCDLSSFRVLNCSNGKLSMNTTRQHLFPFVHAPFSSIQTIDLSNNAIATLSNASFQSYTNLKTVNLSNNPLLKALPKKIFQHNRQLDHIGLSGNVLLPFVQLGCTMTAFDRVSCKEQQITGRLNLQHLPQVSSIDASGNQIVAIASTCFDGQETLQYIDLSNNHIVDLPSTTFQKMPLLKNVKLNNNPVSRETFVCGPQWDYRTAIDLKVEHSGGSGSESGAGKVFYTCHSYL